ncbi:MAG: glycogen synthase GlgA [Oscillospiraceae bacterium]|nr:glycogen synthase GlgA [Oscillospiraceae bacterium]
MKILFAASEAAPFVKSGGLGDVAQALPAELAAVKDVEVCVFIPYYKSMKDNPDIEVEFIKSFDVQVAWRKEYVGIFKASSKKKKLSYYFVDNEHYFYRDTIYGHYDDGERFTYFSLAVLEAMRQLDYYPDVIHCNDWQTALIPVLKKALYAGVYDNASTVFTIHNIEYQGKMPNEFMNDVIGIDEYWRGMLTYDNCINFMKGAIVAADKITTVSRTYAHEIRHAFFAHGLQNILNENAYKLEGIVNGINTDLYNPAKDTTIFENFTSSDISGKAKNKEELQKMLGLPVRPDVPVVAMISRLVSHKGLDLVEYVMGELMQRDLQFVVIGTGDSKYEDMFNFNAYVHSDKMSANITFNPALANKVYAGADMFLMPSKNEPCGLSQLIAMRYGTVPIVRETGGLWDTVPPLNVETLEGRGFTFKGYNAHDMLGAVDRCIEFYGDKDKWNKHIKNLIKYNSSWKSPVQEYLRIYNEI